MYLELVVIFVTLIVWGYAFQRRPKGFPPGPTGVPFLGYAPFVGFKPHVTLGELSKKYGKIYSIFLGNHRIVVLNDVKDMREALKMNSFSGRPSEKLLAMEVLPDGLVYNEGPIWEEQRRFAVKVFRDFGFGKKGMSESFQEEVQDLVNYFRQQGGKPLDPKAAIQQATVNANIFKLMSNDRFPMGDPKSQELQKTAHEGFIAPATNGVVYFFPGLSKMLPDLTRFTKVKKAVRDFAQFWTEIIDEHEKTMSEDFSRDYIDMALKKIQRTDDPTSSFHKDNGAVNHINQLLTAFFVGATDTISTSLRYLILLVIKYPTVNKKAQEEIERVIGHSRLPCADDRASMPYMEAVMNEILRFTSIVPWSIFHCTMEDMEFGGFTIPSRTIIMPNLWFAHHDDAIWEAPYEFRPERFLASDGTFLKSMTENLIPFCVGKRSCPAEHMSMTSFFMFAAGLLQNFNFEPDPNHPLPELDDPQPGLVLTPQPFKVIFRDRH